jgi:hypothetical protein
VIAVTRRTADPSTLRRNVVVLLDAEGVWSRRATLSERLRTRVHAAGLDERLAAGEAPESDPLLSLRAQRLARIGCRRQLALGVMRVLAQCEPGRSKLEPAPLVVVPRVVAAHDDLERLVTSLLAPAPVSARGVAATSCLLRDGFGPLYHRGSETDLRTVVRETIDALDPTSDWPG